MNEQTSKEVDEMNGEFRQRGMVLDVPYAEKDEAKQLGARWDPELKKWFVPKGEDTQPFRRWFPAGMGAEQRG